MFFICFFYTSNASFKDISNPEHEDILYKSDGTDLYLDIYEPRDGSTEPWPVIVNVPGAFSGDKDAIVMGFLANLGFAYISIDYTVPNATNHMPLMIHDVKDSIRWIKAHATEYDLNPDRIGVIGWSAGGYVSQFLNTTDGNPTFNGDYVGITGVEANFSAKINALVSLAGISNYLDFAINKTISEEDQINIMGCLYSICSETYTSLSPIEYVSSDSPPTMFIHAEDDGMVLLSQSENMHDAMLENSFETELITLPADVGGHMFPLVNDADFEANTETAYFFKKHLMQIVPEANSEIDYSDLEDSTIDGFSNSNSGFSLTSSTLKFPDDSNYLKLKTNQKLDFSEITDSTEANTTINGITIENALLRFNGSAPASIIEFTLQKGEGVSSNSVFIQAADLSLEIPTDTTFYASVNWNGEFYPPTNSTTSITRSDFDIKEAISIGASGESLILSSPAKIILSDTNGLLYFSKDNSEWTATNKCSDASSTSAGSLAFPDACYLDINGETIVWTYHLTTFANMEDNSQEENDISNIKYSSTQNSITIYWETNNNSTSKINYGLDRNLKQEFENKGKVKKHSVTINNLNSNISYYFKIKSKDRYGDSDSSKIYTIKTKWAGYIEKKSAESYAKLNLGLAKEESQKIKKTDEESSKDAIRDSSNSLKNKIIVGIIFLIIITGVAIKKFNILKKIKDFLFRG